jgi:hypothetical protein
VITCLQQSLLEKPSVQWHSLVDTTKPFLETVNVTLWDAGNELASAFQELYSNYEHLAANGSDLASNRYFQVVRNNAQTSFYNTYTTISDGLTYQTIQDIVGVKHLGLIMLLLEVRLRALAASIIHPCCHAHDVVH